jgi:nucleotide-binding universal stress UspA family protein
MGVGKILLAVDGSEASMRGTQSLIEALRLYREPVAVELVNIRLPVPRVGAPFWTTVTHEMVDKYYQDEGQEALRGSRKLLDEAGVPYTAHILVGEIAEAIVKHAARTDCRMIYIGTRGMSAIANMVLGSIATKVVNLSRVPVVLVP